LDLSTFAYKFRNEEINKEIKFVRTPIAQPRDFEFKPSPTKKVISLN